MNSVGRLNRVRKIDRVGRINHEIKIMMMMLQYKENTHDVGRSNPDIESRELVKSIGRIGDLLQDEVSECSEPHGVWDWRRFTCYSNTTRGNKWVL